MCHTYLTPQTHLLTKEASRTTGVAVQGNCEAERGDDMFNFANPSAARRWEAAHERNEAKRQQQASLRPHRATESTSSAKPSDADAGLHAAEGVGATASVEGGGREAPAALSPESGRTEAIPVGGPQAELAVLTGAPSREHSPERSSPADKVLPYTAMSASPPEASEQLHLVPPDAAPQPEIDQRKAQEDEAQQRARRLKEQQRAQREREEEEEQQRAQRERDEQRRAQRERDEQQRAQRERDEQQRAQRERVRQQEEQQRAQREDDEQRRRSELRQESNDAQAEPPVDQSSSAMREVLHREVGRFSSALHSSMHNLRRLTVRVGGARELRVAADGRIRWNAAPALDSCRFTRFEWPIRKRCMQLHATL